MQYSLYNGEVLLDFDEEKHRYTYNGQTVVGVTTVTDVAIDKSQALMGWCLKVAGEYLENNWPLDGYLPKNSPAFNDLIKGMKQAHRRIKGAAASTGTDAHAWIEEYIRASQSFNPPPPKPYDKQAAYAVDAYLEYERGKDIIYLETELKVFSRSNNYAGTLDDLVKVDGLHKLWDLKTSNTFREEYKLQSAAYLGAYNEEHGTDIRDRVILMLPKEKGEVEEKILKPENYQDDLDNFLAALKIYKWTQKQKGKS